MYLFDILAPHPLLAKIPYVGPLKLRYVFVYRIRESPMCLCQASIVDWCYISRSNEGSATIFSSREAGVGGCAIELLYSGRGVKSTYYRAARKSEAAAKIECAEKLRYRWKGRCVRLVSLFGEYLLVFELLC